MTDSGATRVLLVEANDDDAHRLTTLLTEVADRRFALRVAGTVADALPMCDDVDVVLLDLALPDARGMEALDRMLAEDTDVPIVVLTGLADEVTARRAMAAGAQDYLVKADVTPALITRTLLYAIERKRAETTGKAVEAARRAQWLAEVSGVTRSLDLDVLTRQLCRSMVPRLADVALLDLAAIGGDDAHHEVATASADDDQAFAALRAAAGPDAPVEQARASRQPVRWRDLTEHAGPWATAARAVGVRSVLAIPLIVGDEVIGAVTLCMTQSRRRFGAGEQLLAEEVARRATLGIENARLYRAAQHAVRARDEVLAVVSHDLRNPLSVIGLCLQLLAEEIPSGSEPASLIVRADRALRRATRLLEELLDVARIEQGTLSLDRRPVDLRGLLHDLVEQQRPLADDKRLRLIAELDDAAVELAVDRDRIAQVIANLVGNAIKFTPPEGTITVRAGRGPGSVRIEVDDTGPGIEASHLPNVFDRYYQAHARREAPRGEKDGAGLGLAIVAGIAEAHGGRVGVASVPGQGATFWFELPLPGAAGPGAT